MPTPSDQADIGLGGQTLTEKCSHAGEPTRSLDGHATDIVAAQLLLTIKRTDAPELRGKLIGAYRRYLGCPTDSRQLRRSRQALTPRANLNHLADKSIRLNRIPFLQRDLVFF